MSSRARLVAGVLIVWTLGACGPPAARRAPESAAADEALAAVVLVDGEEPGFGPMGREIAGADELARRIDADEPISDELWRRALLASGAIEFQPPRRENAALLVTVRILPWLGNCEIRLTPRDARLHRIVAGRLVPTCGLLELLDCSNWQNMIVGRLPAGDHHVVFDVEIERGAPRDYYCLDDWTPPLIWHDFLWRGELALDVRVPNR